MIIVNDIAPEVEPLHDGSFPFPDLSNPLYISRKTAISGGIVIGAGLVRLTAEGILILDKNVPQLTRARASVQIIEALKQDIKSKGLDECHVFVRDPNVQKFLCHLGFRVCQGGTPLVLHF